MEGTRNAATRDWFEQHLRSALLHLYDPGVLRASPLVDLLDIDRQRDAVRILRRTLIDAVESLHPGQATPQASRTWRVYLILHRRYVEQVTQQEVATDLGLSIRQLQREEQLARQVLADCLWTTQDLEKRMHLIAAPSSHTGVGDVPEARSVAFARELQQLRASLPAQMTSVTEVVQDVLSTIRPLVEPANVSVADETTASLPLVHLQVPILRQALLHVLGVTVPCVREGHIRISATVVPTKVTVIIRADQSRLSTTGRQEWAAKARTAEELVRVVGGSVEVEAAEGELLVAIGFPTTQQATVLVIDDNPDALQLFERYLSGSQYQFVGALGSQRGMALASELLPQIIVLDVMMPEQDGWVLLGQLREHPKTHAIPVIVCTILAHEDLALALGAASFLRKPVSRAAILSALDRQLAQPMTASG